MAIGISSKKTFQEYKKEVLEKKQKEITQENGANNSIMNKSNAPLSQFNANSYADVITNLQSKGFATADLGQGEANFLDYGSALDDALKAEIVNSYDNEKDFEIQNNVASIIKQFGDAGGKLMHTEDLVPLLRQQFGYDVNVQMVETDFIENNKLDNVYDKDVQHGQIQLLTISDGQGGEIKIADSNGNAAIETEEVFMNEILQGLSDTFDTSGELNVTGTDFATTASGLMPADKDDLIKQTIELRSGKDIKKEEISASEYKERFNSIAENNYTKLRQDKKNKNMTDYELYDKALLQAQKYMKEYYEIKY